MKDKIQQLKENYKAPTPLNWRLIGDAILGLGSVTSAVFVVVKNPWLAIASTALTWIGKTLTNFATK